MLNNISKIPACNGKKLLSICCPVNPTYFFASVLFAIIISSSLFTAQATNHKSDIESIEYKLTVWLKNQQNTNIPRLAKSSNQLAPTTADLRFLAMNWSRLSADFKKIYLESQEIPSGFIMHATPRFGIELYYTLSGPDAVDSTDTLSSSAENCCIFSPKPNGLPDFIDFTAGALDSAWQLEVVKSGFLSPKPYISNLHPSSAYKVVVKSLGAQYYGLTFPLESQNDSGTGISSIINIRNSWTGWNIDSSVDYQTYPEKAIRITCAHELFHAIQYRMVHKVTNNIRLDQLPNSWIEGTAGMMEEISFPEVNDFFQYTKPYFTDPAGFSVFGSSSDNSIYANVLICLYMYENCASTDGEAGFFKSVFLDNLTNSLPFSQLLGTASAKINRTWADILNAFHTASFYTGQRSMSGRFIADARKLTEWTYTAGEGKLSGFVEKTIKPYSLQYCSMINTDHVEGTLSARIILPGARNPGNYAARIILRNSTNADSIVPLAQRLSDTGMVSIEKWSQWDEALVIVTNGTDSTDLTVKFEFLTGNATGIAPLSNLNPVHYKQPRIFLTLNGRVLTSQRKKSLTSRKPGIPAGVYIMNGKTGSTATVIGH